MLCSCAPLSFQMQHPLSFSYNGLSDHVHKHLRYTELQYLIFLLWFDYGVTYTALVLTFSITFVFLLFHFLDEGQAV